MHVDKQGAGMRIKLSMEISGVAARLSCPHLRAGREGFLLKIQELIMCDKYQSVDFYRRKHEINERLLRGIDGVRIDSSGLYTRCHQDDVDAVVV